MIDEDTEDGQFQVTNVYKNYNQDEKLLWRQATEGSTSAMKDYKSFLDEKSKNLDVIDNAAKEAKKP